MRAMQVQAGSSSPFDQKPELSAKNVVDSLCDDYELNDIHKFRFEKAEYHQVIKNPKMKDGFITV